MKLKTNNKRTQKGITLIALVVTIVVLLILAGVSLNAIFSENGLINRAKDAQNKMNQAQENDLANLNELSNWIENNIEGVEKINDDLTLVKSWTCSNGGSWSEEIPAGGKVEGDIIANLYITGNKLNLTEEISVDLYKLVIEGAGKMGAIVNFDEENVIQAGYAWWKNVKQTEELFKKFEVGELDLSTVDFSQISAGGFIESVEIKEGITNIPNNAFRGCKNLKNIKIANSINDIGAAAFASTALTSIKIPSNLNIIKSNAIAWMGDLTRLEIPNNVTSLEELAVSNSAIEKITIGKNVKNIGKCAMGGLNLKIVKILIEDYEQCTIASECFGIKGQLDGFAWSWQDDSIIYVLNEGMKNKLKGTYDPTKTEIKVVTLEEMNKI